MAQTSLLPPPSQQFLDANGDPLAGGKLYFYEAGTTTAKSVYSNSTGDVTLSNPVILDSAGRASVWLSGYYKVALYDSSDNLVYTTDNVSSQYSQSVVLSEWAVQTDVVTYIGATQFSVPGDLTVTYHVGRRIQAVVSAGTLTGTISATAYTTLTTVTVIWDTGSLDTGLSSVNLAILTASTPSTPVQSVSEKTANYTFTAADINKTFYANSANAISFTLLGANAVPSGTWQRIKNINSGALTLVGTVESLANAVLGKSEGAFLLSNGTAWSAMMSKAPLMLHKSANLTFGSTAYLPMVGTFSANTGSIPVQMIIPISGVMHGLYARAANNTVNGNTTITMLKNAANTSLEVIIPANSTIAASDVANIVTVEKGDIVYYRIVTAGSSGSIDETAISAIIQSI